MTIGIYRLYNVKTNNTYVGQSKNIENRIENHKRDLINGNHHQKNLQTEFNTIVRVLKKKLADSKIKDYILYEEYVFDNYYNVEVLEEYYGYVDKSDNIYMKTIEDKYILQFRDIQKGYSQKTNKELENDSESRKEQMRVDYKDIQKLEINYNDKILYCNEYSYLNHAEVCLLSYILMNGNKNISISNIKYGIWWAATDDSMKIKATLSKFIRYNIIDCGIDKHDIIKLKNDKMFKVNILWDNLICNVMKLYDKLNIEYEIKDNSVNQIKNIEE